jgi:hypothetical protein
MMAVAIPPTDAPRKFRHGQQLDSVYAESNYVVQEGQRVTQIAGCGFAKPK